MIRLRVTLKVVNLGEIDNQVGSVLFDFDRGVRDFGEVNRSRQESRGSRDG